MILEDFVMLGTTVPEPTSDGRIFVCSAGVSREDRRLIRIYPLARKGAPNRWGQYKIRVERNPKDSRVESFKVAGDRTPGAHWGINQQFERITEIPRPARAHLLEPYVVDSIKMANERRLSLAVVHPTAMELTFDDNPPDAPDPQLVLFDTGDDQPSGARAFPHMPRLRFNDAGGEHRLMLRDWGCFELMRKHEASYYLQHMAPALHLDEQSSLLVGNMRDRPTAWLVISVLNGLREQPTLFEV